MVQACAQGGAQTWSVATSGGDEGPSLHNLTLSDARIAKRIREGIKGEMPRFGSKLNDADIQALIAYLRTLKG